MLFLRIGLGLSWDNINNILLIVVEEREVVSGRVDDDLRTRTLHYQDRREIYAELKQYYLTLQPKIVSFELIECLGSGELLLVRHSDSIWCCEPKLR